MNTNLYSGVVDRKRYKLPSKKIQTSLEIFVIEANNGLTNSVDKPDDLPFCCSYYHKTFFLYDSQSIKHKLCYLVVQRIYGHLFSYYQ